MGAELAGGPGTPARPLSFSSVERTSEPKGDRLAKVVKTETEWRAELDPEAYRVLREKGTESPFTGEYDHVFEDGTYHFAGCGADLFASDAKYDSGCGWPAFYAPASEEAVDEESGASYGM